MPNFERSAYSRRSNNNPYSYDKIFALVRNADNTSVLGRTSRVSVVIKDTDSFNTDLDSMDDTTYKNAAGADLSSIFMPFQSHGGVSGNMPGFYRYLPPNDPDDPNQVNFYNLLPFQWVSGSTSSLSDRWVASSGDSLGGMVSAEKHYVDMDRYRDLDYIRGVGLRAPVMVVGWGYTLENYPWPSGIKGENGVRSFKDGAKAGWQVDPADYVAAPLDLRFDVEKHVWTMPQFTPIVAKIVDEGPNGEADFTDYRYWIQLQHNVNTVEQNDLDDELDIQDQPNDTTEEKRRTIVPAFNLADYLDGTHTLALNDLVIVLPIRFDEGDQAPPRLRYMIVRGGSESMGIFQWQQSTMISANQRGWEFNRVHALLE